MSLDAVESAFGHFGAASGGRVGSGWLAGAESPVGAHRAGNWVAASGRAVSVGAVQMMVPSFSGGGYRCRTPRRDSLEPDDVERDR